LREQFNNARCFEFDFAVEAGYDGASVSENGDVVAWGESLEEGHDVKGDFDRPSGAPCFGLLGITSVKQGDKPVAYGSSWMSWR
jgi:hypothetical protein